MVIARLDFHGFPVFASSCGSCTLGAALQMLLLLLQMLLLLRLGSWVSSPSAI